MEPAADCWYGVRDPTERKRRQDRLAQRARRKRLAQQRAKDSLNESSSATTTNSITRGSSQPDLSSGNSTSIMRSPMATMSFVGIPTTRDDADRAAVEIPPNFYAALFANGKMLGIACCTVIPSKSPKAGPGIPETLRPTALQLTRVHSSWIDRFPFPQMRDNFITLSGIIDEEEFLCDIFSMESFTMKPNKPSWDASGWIMSKDFAKKWGYLFY